MILELQWDVVDVKEDNQFMALTSKGFSDIIQTTHTNSITTKASIPLNLESVFS